MHFGISYGRDEFDALQKSRNANPPPDPSWSDPSRNWTLDNNEVVTPLMTSGTWQWPRGHRRSAA